MTEQTTETQPEEARSSGIGYAVAGVLVVIALGAATRFLESQVPQWTDGTPFERVAKSIEFPVYAIALGLIGNFVLSKLALRDALSQGFRTEFFIKTGLVLLGASINLKVLVTAAGPAIIQALLLISIVFGFTWWLGGRLGLEDKLRALLASAVSICGVSAAIAAAGAVQAKKEQLAYTASLVIAFALPSIFLLPWLASLLGLSDAVAGAWIGGNIDTTAAVAASGAIAGEDALQIATIVKTTQNALIGVVAIALTAYFALKVERKSADEARPTLGQFWERFPKFVLGFIAASIIGTLYLQWASDGKADYRHSQRPANVVLDLRVRLDRSRVFAEGSARGGLAADRGVRLGDRRQHRRRTWPRRRVVRQLRGQLAVTLGRVRHALSRRSFLTMTAGAALVAACGSEKPGEVAKDGSVTVKHAFGETKIPAPPKRVVSAGFTGQDDLLAVGVVPIAVTDWFGGEPFGVWPWAQPRLGGAQPTVLSLADGIQVDPIAALKPDLIVATNAGLDHDTYTKLSAIAPTIAQSGQDAFFEPWKDQAATIGQAVFKHDDMQKLIAGVDEKFTTAGTNNQQFAGKKVLLLQGTLGRDGVQVMTPGWRTDFLTQMGFVVADGVDDADVLIWGTESDGEQAALLADPTVAQLKATTQKRNVFTGKELAGAIAFASTLSYPLVADHLPQRIAQVLA